MKKYFLLLLFLLNNYAISFAQVPQSEVDALHALFANTGDWGWVNSTNWLNGDPGENNWFGVITSPDGSHVTELWLNDNNLTGVLPSEIGDLPYLEKLILDGNNLSGSIPASIGNISALEVLDLSKNDLTGSIPTELSGLIGMENFSVETNLLSGDITNIYASWPNLEILAIDSQITGDLDLSSNPNLEVLYGPSVKLSSVNVKNGTNAAMGLRVILGGTTNLTCIQLDDEDAAMNNLAPYSSWTIENSVVLSEACAVLDIQDSQLELSTAIYPNPFSNTLSFKNHSTTIIEINCFDIFGKKVFSTINENGITAIDLSNLSEGVYLIKAMDKNNNQLVKKILKK